MFCNSRKEGNYRQKGGVRGQIEEGGVAGWRGGGMQSNREKKRVGGGGFNGRRGGGAFKRDARWHCDLSQWRRR